jgi:hypothetical protein
VTSFTYESTSFVLACLFGFFGMEIWSGQWPMGIQTLNFQPIEFGPLWLCNEIRNSLLVLCIACSPLNQTIIIDCKQY